MNIDYKLNLPNTYRELFALLEKYDLVNVYDEAVADDTDLTQEQLCNIMKTIIEKNTRGLKC